MPEMIRAPSNLAERRIISRADKFVDNDNKNQQSHGLGLGAYMARGSLSVGVDQLPHYLDDCLYFLYLLLLA